MTPARLWLQIFATGFAIITALLIFTFLTPMPYGDLSRLGRLSDHDFGWREPSPHVAPQYLRPSAPRDADILVIGDSFSMSGRWQASLIRSGYRVATVYWAHFGEALCDDFDAWLAASGFRGQLVVIESVERLLAERQRRSKGCIKTKRAMDVREAALLIPLEQPPPHAINWTAKLTTGWITYFNTRRARQSEGDTRGDLEALVRVVPNGCEYFSHRACGKALFFGDDDLNGELNAGTVAAMQSFTQAHSKVRLLWMIIPNKSTVYVDPDHSREFVAAFQKSGLGPDLFAFAREQKSKVRDFYFPNDTHMSMHGQISLGERMLKAIREILPPAEAGPTS